MHPAGSVAADARQQLGKYGEDVACDELRRRGYVILARRVRFRGGEIDIVAQDGSVIVFVEVKTRIGAAFGGAVAAVTRPKQHRITALATAFLARHRLTDRACRFDVVTVDIEKAGVKVQVFLQAFDAC